MKRKNFLTILLLASVILLAACGFRLRGSGGAATLPFKTVFVNISPSSALGAELRRNIRGAGSTQVADRKEAEIVLDILADSRRKAILSLNSQGRVREYSLFYLVRFQAFDQQGNVLLPPTEIELRRTLNYSETEALAKETEEQMLYRDMQGDIVQQVFRRLAAAKMPPATNLPGAASPPVNTAPSVSQK